MTGLEPKAVDRSVSVSLVCSWEHAPYCYIAFFDKLTLQLQQVSDHMSLAKSTQLPRLVLV